MTDALNEKFTLYLNTEGNPVRRRLCDMTADEITRDELLARSDHCVAMTQAFLIAMDRNLRLDEAVRAVLPKRAYDLPLYKGLRRYWPGGRTA